MPIERMTSEQEDRASEIIAMRAMVGAMLSEIARFTGDPRGVSARVRERAQQESDRFAREVTEDITSDLHRSDSRREIASLAHGWIERAFETFHLDDSMD